ncbi:MAG: type III pantothenate kinase [Oscillibacter sp.]|nr:type III pantothenate kinase [Oscillibacter sp.]
MLLAVDVGNTTTSVGLFDKDRTLCFFATMDTDSRKTADQISVDLMNLFTLYQRSYTDVTGAIFCSVVPPLNFMMEKALTRLLGKPPMVVGPGVRTGLNIRLPVQTQMGADIVADAVAALERFQPPIITIDMGTATTIGVISEGRTYEGGLLLPGVQVSLEALSRRAAQLPDISLQHPKALIGKSTEDCMRSGIVYGTAGMLDGIIDRIREEFAGKDVSVVATGGNAPVIVRYCKNEIVYDKYLLMNGLRAIYERNR